MGEKGIMTRLHNVMLDEGHNSLAELASAGNLDRIPNLGQKSISALLEMFPLRDLSMVTRLGATIHGIVFAPRSARPLKRLTQSDIMAARAVIEDMCDPTPAMVMAAKYVIDQEAILTPEVVRAALVAGIGAALEQ